MRLRISGMTAGLAIGISGAVVIACALGAYLFSLHHFDSLLDTARGHALAQGELMRVALEHQMIEHDRSLIGRMVESFGKEAGVQNLVILDRTGQARFSSGPAPSPSELTLASPTCQVCHRLPPDQRGSSRIIASHGSDILRTVIPVRNRDECYSCHDPNHRINGILILDLDATPMRAAMNTDLRWMVAGTATVTLLLIAIIAFVVRVFVVRRLQRFEITARRVAAGELDQRVPISGNDTVAWLAHEFNTMADSMSGLVTDVRTERERLERVINSIDDGIVVLDTSRNVIAANAAFIARTHHGRAEVLGRACGDIAGRLCNSADCLALGCMQTETRQVRIAERRGHDGKVITEEIHASPIRGSSGQITQVVEVWRDISERRAAEARLAESHRLVSVGALASGFSHEMNTPLGTVLACVEGILRETRGDTSNVKRIADHAAIARDQVLRCRGITQHFLRLSRGHPGVGTMVNLSSAIAGVVRLIEPTARASDVTITRAVPEDAHVFADESELQHTIMNLALNAVQACRAGGRVEIAVDHHHDPVCIRVSDDGCGIAAADQALIFEPFFSLRQGGTGLGLFLSLNFVRRWGGDLTVRSTPGQGSVFEIRLPQPAVAERRSA